MPTLVRWLSRIAPAASLAVLGCSSVDPKVGPQQDNCGTETSPGAGASGSPYGASMMTAARTAATCEADAGNSCDSCESQWCCDARQACYHDPVCFCADRALDRCLDDAAGDPAGVSACWQAFAAHGAVEGARATCLRASCADACGLP
jgi:hypothetical protein